MPRRDDVRVSGKTGAAEAGEDQAKAMLEGMDNQLAEERERTLSALSFSRMKTDWRSEDYAELALLKKLGDGILDNAFGQAYEIMFELYDVVREPEVDEQTGEIKLDRDRRPIWKRTVSGGYSEDWSRLTLKQREDFVFRISGQIFYWEQRKADLWLEAMVAKALMTERFSVGYDEVISGTIEDRTARANMRSAEDRYFAIYTGYISRKADGIVRSMEMLCRRISETLST
jgi:hypothetical protein